MEQQPGCHIFASCHKIMLILGMRKFVRVVLQQSGHLPSDCSCCQGTAHLTTEVCWLPMRVLFVALHVVTLHTLTTRYKKVRVMGVGRRVGQHRQHQPHSCRSVHDNGRMASQQPKADLQSTLKHTVELWFLLCIPRIAESGLITHWAGPVKCVALINGS